MNTGKILGAAILALTIHQTASAAILSPTAAVASSTFGGDAFYSIDDTINQNGLTINFVSGVTDFDAYLAQNPLHTNLDVGFEWFSEEGDTTPVIDYDLGSVQIIDRLALWNEEFAGFGTAVISTSTDGVNYSFLTTITDPTDHGFSTIYFADVFSFAQTNARYVRLALSDCPQPNGTQDFALCGIGEVAFSAVAAPVPLPAAVWLFASAVLAFGIKRRRKSVA